MPDAARDARIWLVHVMEIADHEVPDALESAGLHIRHLLAECERQRKELGLAKGELREKKSVITYFTLLTRELEADRGALVVLCRVLIRDGEWHPYQLNHDVPEWHALGAELREAIDEVV